MVLRTAPTRMVSEYTPKRDIDDAPLGRDGVVSFEDDPDEDDGDGLVAAGTDDEGERDGNGGDVAEGVVAGAKGEGGYDGGGTVDG